MNEEQKLNVLKKISDAEKRLISVTLKSEGFHIEDISDLHNYPAEQQEKVIPLLLTLLEQRYSSSTKESIYRYITAYTDWLKGKLLLTVLDSLFNHFENDNMKFTELPERSMDFHLSQSDYKGAKSWHEINTITIRWEIGFAINTRLNHKLVSHRKYKDRIRPLLKNKKYRKGRSELVLAYAKLAKEEAVPDLIELLNDWDLDVLGRTIEALGKLKDLRAKPYLEKLLKHNDPYFKNLAKRALHKINNNN